MKIYNKIHTFTCDKEMKDFLNQFRESIEKNKPIQKKDNRKKVTINELKQKLNQIF